MSKKIFISYRRQDTHSEYANILYEKLSKHFGEKNIFMDVDKIIPGDKFPKVIKENLDACDTLIVLIGEDWITITDESGNKRLENPNDFVRLELEAGLKREIEVIPVLFDDAKMPKPSELPNELIDFSIINAKQIHSSCILHDINRLIEVLDPEMRRFKSLKKFRIKIPKSYIALLYLTIAEIIGTIFHASILLAFDKYWENNLYLWISKFAWYILAAIAITVGELNRLTSRRLGKYFGYIVASVNIFYFYIPQYENYYSNSVFSTILLFYAVFTLIMGSFSLKDVNSLKPQFEKVYVAIFQTIIALFSIQLCLVFVTLIGRTFLNFTCKQELYVLSGLLLILGLIIGEFFRRHNILKGAAVGWSVFLILLMILGGKVNGNIVDKNSSEPLPGANISLLGTNITTSSDIDGSYSIRLLPAGAYQIRSSMMGYRSLQQEVVIMPFMKNNPVYMRLEPEILQETGVEIVDEKSFENAFFILSIHFLYTLAVIILVFQCSAKIQKLFFNEELS